MIHESPVIPVAEAPFTNRELRSEFRDIRESLARIEDTSLPEIKGHVMKTNGRVTSLEWSRENQNGALKIMYIFLVPMLVWGFSQLANMDSKIQTAVDKALAAYDIK